MGHKEGTPFFKIGDLQLGDGRKGPAAYWWCPRCDGLHMVTIGVPNSLGAQWNWNKDYDKPTLTPSVLVKWKGAKGIEVTCHCFITNGKIDFCSDTTPANTGEKFAGRLLDLPRLPDWFNRD